MARMTGFVFQDRYLDRLAKLSDQEVGRLVRALAKYHATGEEQELKGRECGYFDFIKGDIDEIEQAYRKKCENMKRPQQAAIESNCTQLPTTAIKIKNKNDINNDSLARAQEETAFGSVNLDQLILKVQQELNGLTDTHYNALNDYRDQMGDDVISYAIDLAVGGGVRNWNYVEAILQKWLNAGVKTLGEAKAENERHRNQQKQQLPQQQAKPQHAKLLRSQDYHQREYKGEQIEKVLGVNDIYGANVS